MSALSLTASPMWTAAGWTMLHSLWVGGVIGLFAAVARRALKSSGPELRYGFALTCLAILALSPALTFAIVCEPATALRASIEPLDDAIPSRLAPRPKSNREERTERSFPIFAWGPSTRTLARPSLNAVVSILPCVWLSGSTVTLIMLAAGLIGVERMRRSSRLLDTGDLPRRCNALANSLGIARRVSVGIRDRLAMPVLLGVVRPMILLPPAALRGWSVEQLEMVLLHELAHLRRWDNLVNLLQRVVESLLFFHPAVWWLSGWVRLERELCCDRYVVDRLGQPVAYAEMLVTLSGMRRRSSQTVLAMADRHVMTRIRRLFNLKERSMKLSMPEGLGMLGAVVVGVSLVLCSQGAQTRPVDDLQKTTRSVPDTEVDDPDDIPDIEAIPREDGASSGDGAHASRPPREPRSVSLFALDTRRLEIQEYPISPDGAKTYRCRGGLEILCKSPKFGTVSLEADEALIKRMKPKSDREPILGPNGETWFEEADVPMEVHLKGNAVVRQGKAETPGDVSIVRAAELDYNFVTGRLVASPTKPDPSAPRSQTPAGHIAGEAPREPAGPGLGERLITLSHRDARPIEIKEMPREIDGTIKYVCKGGIRILARFEAHGTVSIDADDVVIVRKCRFGRGEAVEGTNGGTWVEDEEVMTEIHAAHNAIMNLGSEKDPGEIARWNVRADQLDYDVVSGHLRATNVVLKGPETEITGVGIEIFIRRLAESLTPSEPLDPPARRKPRSKPVSPPSRSTRTTGVGDVPR